MGMYNDAATNQPPVTRHLNGATTTTTNGHHQHEKGPKRRFEQDSDTQKNGEFIYKSYTNGMVKNFSEY